VGLRIRVKSSRGCDYRAVIGEYFLLRYDNRKGRKSGSFCLSFPPSSNSLRREKEIKWNKIKGVCVQV